MRKPKPHPAALAWLQSLPVELGFFSAVTFAEIEKGIEIIRKQNPTKAKEIETWSAVLERKSQVLPMDVKCFREWARIMSGKSDSLYEDAMIAATARVHDLTIATRNERDFDSFGVRVFNPFQFRS